jgi:hypothetical protein
MYINGSEFPNCNVKAVHETKETRVLTIAVQERGVKIPYIMGLAAKLHPGVLINNGVSTGN